MKLLWLRFEQLVCYKTDSPLQYYLLWCAHYNFKLPRALTALTKSISYNPVEMAVRIVFPNLC